MRPVDHVLCESMDVDWRSGGLGDAVEGELSVGNDGARVSGAGVDVDHSSCSTPAVRAACRTSSCRLCSV